MNELQAYAYARGYFHAMTEGVVRSEFDYDEKLRHYYRLGYDSGISDYCRLIESEETV